MFVWLQIALLTFFLLCSVLAKMRKEPPRTRVVRTMPPNLSLAS